MEVAVALLASVNVIPIRIFTYYMSSAEQGFTIVTFQVFVEINQEIEISTE